MTSKNRTVVLDPPLPIQGVVALGDSATESVRDVVPQDLGHRGHLTPVADITEH